MSFAGDAVGRMGLLNEPNCYETVLASMAVFDALLRKSDIWMESQNMLGCYMFKRVSV